MLVQSAPIALSRRSGNESSPVKSFQLIQIAVGESENIANPPPELYPTSRQRTDEGET